MWVLVVCYGSIVGWGHEIIVERLVQRLVLRLVRLVVLGKLGGTVVQKTAEIRTFRMISGVVVRIVER
jgi:hypothetical protein